MNLMSLIDMNELLNLCGATSVSNKEMFRIQVDCISNCVSELKHETGFARYSNLRF